MRKLPGIGLFLLLLISCHKNEPEETGCNLQQTYIDNEKKITITNGIWGTVASKEGNCMPMVPPARSSCTTCPVKRTVRIYEYTTLSQAFPQTPHSGFYDSFSTQLVKEVDTDENGFFQTEIPAGQYTIVTIENGKLYAPSYDGQGGLNPVTYAGGLFKVNILLTYRAVY